MSCRGYKERTGVAKLIPLDRFSLDICLYVSKKFKCLSKALAS